MSALSLVMLLAFLASGFISAVAGANGVASAGICFMLSMIGFALVMIYDTLDRLAIPRVRGRADDPTPQNRPPVAPPR